MSKTRWARGTLTHGVGNGCSGYGTRWDLSRSCLDRGRRVVLVPSHLIHLSLSLLLGLLGSTRTGWLAAAFSFGLHTSSIIMVRQESLLDNTTLSAHPLFLAWPSLFGQLCFFFSCLFARVALCLHFFVQLGNTRGFLMIILAVCVVDFDALLPLLFGTRGYSSPNRLLAMSVCSPLWLVATCRSFKICVCGCWC